MRLFSFKSIKTQIVFGSAVCLTVCAAAIISVAAVRVREQALGAAKMEATSLARRRAAEVESALNNPLEVARTLSGIFGKLKDKKNALDLTRDQANSLLKGLLERNPNWVGVYTVWEPDAFDGMDQGFAKTTGHDATGRFAPYWFRDGSGKIACEPVKGYEREGEGDFYVQPRTLMRECVIEPRPLRGVGEGLVTSLVMPIVVDGKFYGITGVDLRLGFLQEMSESANVHGGDGRLYLVSNHGKVVGTGGRAELLGGALAGLGSAFESHSTDVKTGKVLVEMDGEGLRVFEPVAIGETGSPWSAIVTIPAGSVSAEATGMMWRLIAIGTLCAMAGVGALWLIARSITAPVRAISERIRAIADGDGDLTQRVDESREDELGDLARWFNRFVGNIHGIVGKLAVVTREVAEASTRIAASADQTASGLARQEEQTTQIATSIEEMAQSIMEVATRSGEASKAAAASRTDAASGGQVVEETVKEIKQIAADVGLSTAAVTELGKKSEQIGRIIGVINDIADQTNLLALNAAIEAARAGEHGRGFAVVADEVRKLAERTTRATEEVANSIREIQTQTGTAVKQFEQGAERVSKGVALAHGAGQALGRITASADSLAGMVQSIATAASQQSAASEEIARTVDQISVVTRETVRGAAEASQVAVALRRQAELLESLVSRFKLRETPTATHAQTIGASAPGPVARTPVRAFPSSDRTKRGLRNAA
jgi:methyl-accepting chemotaxis protein